MRVRGWPARTVTTGHPRPSAAPDVACGPRESSLVPAERQPTPVEAPDADLDAILTHSPGPIGSLPLDADLLRDSPSGDLFGLTPERRHGLGAAAPARPEFLILGTQGGIRGDDGTPIALGYHTGHWEIGLLMQAAADELTRARRDAVRRLRQRPVRRPHAGHARDDGQPRLPQRRRDRVPAADPLAAHARAA